MPAALRPVKSSSFMNPAALEATQATGLRPGDAMLARVLKNNGGLQGNDALKRLLECILDKAQVVE